MARNKKRLPFGVTAANWQSPLLAG